MRALIVFLSLGFLCAASIKLGFYPSVPLPAGDYTSSLPTPQKSEIPEDPRVSKPGSRCYEVTRPDGYVRYSADSFRWTSTCHDRTRMAVHLVHYRAPNNQSVIRARQHAYRDSLLREVMRPLAALPFPDVHFYVHTNRWLATDSTFETDMGRNVSVVVHTLDGYKLLGWAVRYYINSTWRPYDIILFMEDDLRISSSGILDYWCQYKDTVFSVNRHLNFLR